MKKNLILTALVACFLVLSMAVRSEAATYGISLYQYTLGYNKTWSGAITSGQIRLAGTTYGGVYMQYQIDIYAFSGYHPSYWPTGLYTAFCIENADAGNMPNASLTELDQSSSLGLKYASWLLGQNWPVTTNAEQAALQLAIWEAVFDPGDLNLTNTSSNTYYLGTQSWSYTARNYITDLKNSGINWSTYSPHYYTGWVYDSQTIPSGKQNFLIQSNPPTVIPEPSSILILGTGLIGFGVVARYRRNKKA